MSTTFLHKEKEWFKKGYKALAAKKYDEAIGCYKKAIEINPDYAEAYLNLGITYGEKGMTDEEISEYKKAINIYCSSCEDWTENIICDRT
jgi:tetratricopeptide (TPR) repeat protein